MIYKKQVYQVVILIFLLLFLLSGIPVQSCILDQEADFSSTSLALCTSNCSSLGCDLPNCIHDCHCYSSKILGIGCDMSKCEYNCFDDVGIATDMSSCQYNCKCSKGNCDMRNCQITDDHGGDSPYANTDTNTAATSLTIRNDPSSPEKVNCFCAEGDCGLKSLRKSNVGTEIGALISFLFLFIVTLLGVMYLRNKKKKARIKEEIDNVTKSNVVSQKSLPELA